MLSYHNDPQFKAEFVRLVAWHRDEDRLIHGEYSRVEAGEFRGCAIGCSINSLCLMTGKSLPYNRHAVYEAELGVPQVLARLEDMIFEGLPVTVARDWPVQFAEAIPVGRDLSGVWDRFAVRLLADPDHGVVRYVSGAVRSHIQAVANLYLRRLEGQEPAQAEWIAARKPAPATYATADYYATAAVDDAAAYYAAAVDDAADAAPDAADAAAAYYATAAVDAAAAYYAAAYAKQEHFTWLAAALLELLRSA